MEEFFEDTMNNEFNCVLDDNSALAIARLILEFNKLYLSKENEKIFEGLNKRFPKTKASDATIAASVKCKNGKVDDNNNDDDVSLCLIEF